jgi:malate synthase
VATALAEFDPVLGGRPNQLERQRPEVHATAAQLLDVSRPPDGITRAGLDTNISVGLRYVASWLAGTGAAAIDDLMEDAATAEISRAQVWQWVHHGITLAEGDAVTAELVRGRLDATEAALVEAGSDPSLVADARAVFESVALGTTFLPWLTLPAYDLLL